MKSRRLPPLNIRLQIMLWYTLAFTILIALFGFVFYVNLQNALLANVDAELTSHAQSIATGFYEETGKTKAAATAAGTPDSQPESGSGTPSPGQTPGENTEFNPDETTDVNQGPLVNILLSNGTIYYSSPAFRNLSLPQASVSEPLHGSPWRETVIAKNGENVRVYSSALEQNNKILGVLQVGESLVSLSKTLRSAVAELSIIGPGVLLLSLFGSYWLAGRSLAPIKKLTGTARRIKAGDLHERVPVPRTQDELHILALTFNEMIERLEKAFARQRQFVADASHELRTPVAAIRSMTDVALARSQHMQPDDYLVVLSDVNSEAERLGHLINDLLALARSDESQVVFEHEAVRLDLLTADVAATMEPLADEKGINLTVDCHEAVTITGDEVRLIQVIMNMIDNAIHYTNEGGSIRLAVNAQDQYACLTVTDSGIGIEKQHLEHIFERFYRVDPARTRSVGGSGLGLSIVEWIVRAHQGRIEVESEPGQGTSFTVHFPLARHPD